MKKSSIAFVKAIVLSLWILLNSGFLAMAAESEVAPAVSDQTDSAPPALPSETTQVAPEDVKTSPNNPPAAPAKPQSSVELTGDNEINVGLIVGGTLLDDDVTVFLPAGQTLENVLVPLGAFSEILTLPVKVNPGDKKAEGITQTETEGFQLDLNTQEVLFKGERRKLEKDEAMIYEGDIYVRASAIKKWFDIDIQFNMSQLTLTISSKNPLPFQERLKRLENAKKLSKTYRYDPVIPEKSELAPYKTFSLPSLYLDNSAGYLKNRGGSSFLGVSTLQGNQDIAKFETNYTISGRYDSLNSSRDITGADLTFQRRDVLNRMLGPLHAGKIAFGDISFPTVPLFLGGNRGAGVLISSSSNLASVYANNTGSFILDGEAPVGYDAELYRNGSFIAFQQIGPTGRYSFENLDLNSGFNNFQVILYGPQGQKTVINREVTQGSRQLRKGEIQYDLAAGTPRADLLPFARDAGKDHTPGTAGQVFYGFSNAFTLGTSFFSGPEDNGHLSIDRLTNNSLLITGIDATQPDTTRATGVTVSSSLSVLGMNLQEQVLEADSGRSAYQSAVNTQLFGTNLGLSHTTYKNFLEENQEVLSQSDFSVYRGFDKFNMGFRVQTIDYLDRQDEVNLEHTVAFNFLGVSINNDLLKRITKIPETDNFQGEFSAVTSGWGGTRFRGSLLYNLDKQPGETFYRRLGFSAQKNLTSRTTLRAEGIHDFESKIDQLDLTLSRDFEKFGLDLNAIATTDNAYSITVGFRHALQADQSGHYTLVDPRTGGQAALGVRAFVDNNDNGIFDAGDKPIPDVGFAASTSPDQPRTDKNGIAYVSNLSETPLRLRVMTETIPDIYLSPKFDHRDMIPRRGSTPIVDFPFVQMSEITGYLTHLKEGVEGAIVRLISGSDGSEVEKTQTDADGYFIFPAVKGGNYKVAFGLPDRDFMSFDVTVDTNVEDPPEGRYEANDELAIAVKEAAETKPSAGQGNAEANTDRMNAPAGAMPNIDDPLNEDDLKPLDEKGVESLIKR